MPKVTVSLPDQGKKQEAAELEEYSPPSSVSVKNRFQEGINEQLDADQRLPDKGTPMSAGPKRRKDGTYAPAKYPVRDTERVREDR